MTEITDTRDIDASPAVVWQLLRDPAVQAAWHPLLREIAGDHVPGAVRTCAVVIGGKESEAVERCTSYDEGRAIGWTVESDTSGFSLMVADWSSGFRVSDIDGARTRVTAWSQFRPRTVLAKLMLPIIKAKFHGTQRKILAALAAEVRV